MRGIRIPSAEGRHARSALWGFRGRRVILAGTGLLVVAVAGAVGVGELLSAPARARVGAAPADWGAVDVALTTTDGRRVFGWFVATESPRGTVLLLHGVRADRRQIAGRVPFLRARGYSTMLIDLPSHGESDGDRITSGAHEAAAVEAAIRDLHRRAPGLPVGVIGSSMGAAAVVLAHLPDALDAVVLESMYPTIEEATDDRMRNALGPLGPWPSPLLLAQLPLRAGVSPHDLHPIEAIRSLSSPILIMNGSEDRHTTPQEASRIFAAVNSPKQLWIVPGAGHVDLHAYATTEYEARVGRFFAAYLDQAARHGGTK